MESRELQEGGQGVRVVYLWREKWTALSGLDCGVLRAVYLPRHKWTTFREGTALSWGRQGEQRIA